jgi:RNA polymerase sigma factor (sigma-70 family)
MAAATLHGFLEWLRTEMAAEALAALPDAALLKRFLATREEAAFQALLLRHGPMVLRVCRRTLSAEHDAEDAFQATFLVLAREARAIRKHTSLASWLHGVAYRVARDARKSCERRRTHEEAAASEPAAASTDDVGWKELRSILDEELMSIPERWRAPLVLCYLEGLTQDEAAVRLGQTKSTFRRNLERGRERLCCRLTRRGVTLSAALLAPLLSEGTVSAAVPAALAETTTRSAAALAGGQAAAGASAQSLVLAQRFVTVTFLDKAKFAGVLLLAVLAAGIGGAGSVWKPDVVTPRAATVQAPADSARPTRDGAAKQGAAAVAEVARTLGCKVPSLVLEAVVQRDLRLRPDQLQRIAEVVEQADRPHAKDLATLRERDRSRREPPQPGLPGQRVTEEEREAVIEDRQLRQQQAQKVLAHQRIQAARGRALRQALPEILSEEQHGRLRQLELQLAGLGAFIDPEVEKLLALDEDQRAKIQALAREPQLVGAPGTVAGVDVFQTRKVPRVLEILREDQKQAWKKLCGRPLEFRWVGETTLAHSSFEMRRVYGAHLPARTALPPGGRLPGARSDLLQPGRP